MLDWWTSDIFLRSTLAAALCGVLCGLVGPWILLTRSSYLVAGLSHGVLGGMGLAALLRLPPIWGAFAVAGGSVFVLGRLFLQRNHQQDTWISALWSVGMASGLIFLSYSPQYTADLVSYLFGQILFVSSSQLMVLGLALCLAVGSILWLRRPWLLFCVDRDLTQLRGVSIKFTAYSLYILVALVTVVLIQSVGLIMVLALLTLPAATALRFKLSFEMTFLVSIGVAVSSCLGGLALSYPLNWPTSASIILLAGFFYFVPQWLKISKLL